MESSVRSMSTSHRSVLLLRCKVVVVGDAHVGKSSLVSMFHSRSFPKQYLMTTWVDFRVKQVPLKEDVVVELYLFDCAGQSIFNQIEANNSHYENANFVVVVYDSTSQSSFESCGKLIQIVIGDQQSCGGVVVANKCDLTERRCVTREMGQGLAESNGFAYFETSATATAEGEYDYEAPFKHIANEFAVKYEGSRLKALN